MTPRRGSVTEAGQAAPDIEIWKFKLSFPKSWTGVTAIAIILLFLTFILFLLFYAPRERVELLIGEFASTGKFIPQTQKRKIIQFWTPSADTWDSLMRWNFPNLTDDQKKEQLKAEGWQKWDKKDGDKVAQFDQKLSHDRTIDGYRRMKVFGHGHTYFKEGWWWIVTVRADFSMEKFVKDYSEFWGNKNALYVEEIASDPKYIPAK